MFIFSFTVLGTAYVTVPVCRHEICVVGNPFCIPSLSVCMYFLCNRFSWKNEKSLTEIFVDNNLCAWNKLIGFCASSAKGAALRVKILHLCLRSISLTYRY